MNKMKHENKFALLSLVCSIIGVVFSALATDLSKPYLSYPKGTDVLIAQALSLIIVIMGIVFSRIAKRYGYDKDSAFILTVISFLAILLVIGIMLFGSVVISVS